MFTAFGRSAIAHALWTAGAVPVLLALSVSIVQALWRHEAGIDILALLAIGFGLALGEYLTAAVISLMLVSGRALENYAQERARREMTALLAHAPRRANRFEGGEWCRVELDAVRPGDRLLVRSGEFVPVDGTLAGHAQLDESALTGESAIQSRPPGEAVLSGVVNAGAAFEMVAAAAASDSTFAGIESDAGTTPDRVLRFAGSLAQASGHVISEAVTTAARERNLSLAVPARVVEQPGAGLTGEVDGRVVAIGSFAYVSTVATPAPWSRAFLQRVACEGASAVFVGVDGVMAGAIQMADQIRLETPRALRLLRQEGIRRLIMLTGDRRDVAETIGATLGVSDVRAEQTPTDKLAAIHAARAEGTVIMVGDGINDAPALAAADVGIAMGARGAAASSEAADIVLLVDRLDRLVEALRVARRTRRIAIQSVAAGMALSFAAMAVAAFGYLPPLLGAMVQELIDVGVITNALRALRVRSTATTGSLARGDADRLKAGHVELGPVIEQIRNLADELPRLSRTAIAGALDSVNESLARELVPHEQRDDTEVYPDLARLLGGEDPMAAMSGMHHEIFRIARLLRQMTADIPSGGPDADSVREFQRLLYGLDAIVRLHCAQEDELFHALGEGT